jgi:tryptophan synthase alpha chain
VTAPSAGRIAATFDALRISGKKALCAYLCMGDPSLDASVELAIAAAAAGADLIELGVPFSDPTADGPAIARASERAIRAGATITSVIDAAARVRAATSIPLVLFTYYNPILVTGEDRVASLARAAGIDALLVVDLPPEESGPLRRAAAREGLALIPLVTPTSDPDRAEVILRAAKSEKAAPAGFVYYVSMTGVTGAGATLLADARREAEALRARFGWPVLVGFGIDGPQAAREAAGAPGAGADGIVVGTAIVRRVHDAPSPEARVESVRAFVGDLRTALDASP